MSNFTQTSTPASLPIQAQLLRLSDALDKLTRDAQAAHTARTTGVPQGPQTGFPNLDHHLGSWLAKGLHCMHGAPGTGKTALLLQMAAQCGFPVLFVTCEMPAEELLRRHTARITRTFLGRLKSGEFSPEEARDLAVRALEAAPNINLLDATKAPASISQIRQCARLVRGDARSALIIVDSLQTWGEGISEGESEYEIINLSIQLLRQLAQEMEVPVLYSSERSRSSMKEGGTSAGAGSRKIEYSAETIFDLDRAADAQPNGAGEVEVQLKLAKNRHGRTGVSIPLWWNGALQEFRAFSSLENAERATMAHAASPKRGSSSRYI